LRNAWLAALELLPDGFSLDAWLRLLRVPNLLTVPGDVLAGFLLASCPDGADWAQLLLLAIPAGLGFYAAGILLNDLFGYAEDLRDRPQRPLPARQVSRENAAAAAMILTWTAAFAAAFFDALPVALPLILCIVLYDVGLKRIPLLGPALMGLCRAGNLLLGASAVGDGLSLSPGPIAAAAALALYVAAVTQLARRETRPDSPIQPRHVAVLLRLLLPLQALLCLAAVHRFPANLLGLALLPLVPWHRSLAKRFPPS
jgi:4-hydroxybenzoate polyprenyltransferase